MYGIRRSRLGEFRILKFPSPQRWVEVPESSVDVLSFICRAVLCCPVLLFPVLRMSVESNLMLWTAASRVGTAE